MGISNLMQGNVIQIENHALFVEEACSGVTSFYSLLTLALLFSLIQRRGLVVALLTIAVTPFVAVITNFARLILIAIGFAKFGIDLSKGWQHTLTGLIVFLFGLVILLSFDSFFSKLLAMIPKLRSERSLFRRIYNTVVGWPNKAPVENDLSANQEISLQREVVEAHGGKFGYLSVDRCLPYFAVAYVLIFVPALAASLNEYRMNQFMFGCPDVSEEVDSVFPGEKDLPEVISERWTRAGYKLERRDLQSTFGQCSHMWVFANGERDIILSLDFPFRGWHALQNCYTSSGWGTVSNNVCRRKEDEPWPWIEQEFVNDLGLRGYLWYGLFDENLKPYFIDMKGPSLAARMNRGVWKIWSKSDPIRSPITFQYQLFVEAGEPLTAEQHQELRRIFLDTREMILQKSVPAVQKLSGR
jgi:exosortase/archaeosortase family protein